VENTILDSLFIQMICQVKTFNNFWQNYSFGMEGMEYRLIAIVLVGIYFCTATSPQLINDHSGYYFEGNRILS